MNWQEQRRLWGFRFTIPDIGLYIAAILAVILNVIGVILVQTTWLLIGILIGVVAIIVYLATSTYQIRALLEEEKIEIITDPDHIYQEGIRALDRGRTEGMWDSIYIYAPIGLCDPSSWKDQWLTSLQRALNDRQKVRNFFGVYALPQDRDAFLDFGERRLQLFEATRSTQIHYLPPDNDDHPLAAPGLGAIIFSDPDNNRYEVIFAFLGRVSGGGMDRVGFIVRNKRVGRLMADWFDVQLLTGSSQQYVLRGPDPKNKQKQVDFKTALADLKQKYYTQKQAA